MGGGQKRRRTSRWWKGTGLCKRARRKEREEDVEDQDGPADDADWEAGPGGHEEAFEGGDAAFKNEFENADTAEHSFRHGEEEKEEMSVFERHYRLQGLFKTEAEWETFMECLKHPLPVTFRVNRGLFDKQVVAACLKEAESFLDPNSAQSVCRAEYLAWSDTYQLSVDRRALKTSDADTIREVKAWLSFWGTLPSKTAPGAGVITRQEVVSMIPAALLGLEDGGGALRVLDVCAAPGSKTLQALDLLSRGAPPDRPATGLVVANDIDARRAYGLAARARPVGAHTEKLLVVCHKAQTTPNVKALGRESGLGGGPYDRVLCDVPCSGDGTLRKDIKVWSSWTPLFGLKIHRLQLQLALRGLSLLVNNGVMAYSTCSFNPIEDEAVVSAILSRCQGSVELIDASRRLPDVKRGPGFTTWKVCDEDLNEYASYQDSQADSVPPTTRRLFQPSMWPPAPGPHSDLLKKCLRLYPQDQDTGGFFVALLRKTRPLPCSERQSWLSAPARPLRPRGPLGAHLRYRRVGKELVSELGAGLGLAGAALKELWPRLWVRSEGWPAAVFCFGTETAQHAFLSPGSPRLNTVWGGVEVCRWDAERSAYSLQQSGVEVVRDRVSPDRRLSAAFPALHLLLSAPGRVVEERALKKAGLALPSSTPSGLLLLSFQPHPSPSSSSSSGFWLAVCREPPSEGGGVRVGVKAPEAAKLLRILLAIAALPPDHAALTHAPAAKKGQRKGAEAGGGGEGGGGDVRMSLLKGVRLKK